MHVHKTPGIARTDATQRIQQGGSPAPAATDAAAPARPADAVQISDAGLALSQTDADGDVGGTNASNGLDPHRADDIRSRVLSGAYNSVQMADQVARSILRSGDL